MGGLRGRAVFATLDAVADARVAALQALFGGLKPRGAGLRGGRYEQHGLVLRLRRWAYTPGLRITGTLSLRGNQPAGRLRVDGPGHLDGVLRLGAGGRVVGTLRRPGGPLSPGRPCADGEGGAQRRAARGGAGARPRGAA